MRLLAQRLISPIWTTTYLLTKWRGRTTLKTRKKMEKTCFKCGKKKHLSEFYKHKMMADGHLGKCKLCTKLDVAKHREENIDSIRAYDRERSIKPHRAEARKQRVALYRYQHPDRAKANTAVSNAVRDGRLERWPCMICGNTKSVGHHPDYDRHLDVVWLCQAHHKQAHALADKLEKKLDKEK